MSDSVLHLTLFKKYFDEILKGDKKIEFRKITPYWEKRLEGKEYDYIHFVNGYGKDRPWMDIIIKEIEKDDIYYDEYKIYLGKIIRMGNINGQINS